MRGRFGSKLVVLAALVVSCSGAAPAANPSPTTTAAQTPTPSPRVAETLPPASTVPIFDVLTSYDQTVWSKYPPEKIAALLDQAGVSRVLASSVPDEGSLRLRAALGDRVVVELGMYKVRTDLFSWAQDGTTLPYVQSIYQKGVHRGLGEFHMQAGWAALPASKAAFELAAREKLFLHVSAAPAVLSETLNAVGPDKTVLWAHAGIGFNNPPWPGPAEIDALLSKWPKLSADLSYRDDIAPFGKLYPEWRDLLIKYKDRFMVGSDPSVLNGFNCEKPRGCTGTERWDVYVNLINTFRTWLGQLPPDVAEAIAHGNADRFFVATSQ